MDADAASVRRAALGLMDAADLLEIGEVAPARTLAAEARRVLLAVFGPEADGAETGHAGPTPE